MSHWIIIIIMMMMLMINHTITLFSLLITDIQIKIIPSFEMNSNDICTLMLIDCRDFKNDIGNIKDLIIVLL